MIVSDSYRVHFSTTLWLMCKGLSIPNMTLWILWWCTLLLCFHRGSNPQWHSHHCCTPRFQHLVHRGIRAHRDPSLWRFGCVHIAQHSTAALTDGLLSQQHYSCCVVSHCGTVTPQLTSRWHNSLIISQPCHTVWENTVTVWQLIKSEILEFN